VHRLFAPYENPCITTTVNRRERGIAVDRLSIAATGVPSMARAVDGRVGPNSLGERSAAQAAPQVGQLLMPSLAAVTDREWLEHLARAPMRPRRR